MNAIARLLACGLLLWASGTRADTFPGFVTHVTDGDTLWVRPHWGGPARQVRLEGIDAPEICQSYGPAARAALAARVLHRAVVVTSGSHDGYGRWLAHVSLGDEDVGQWLVQRGHAWSYRFKGDPGPYRDDEARARQARLGLWREGETLRPRDFRQQHGSCSPAG